MGACNHFNAGRTYLTLQTSTVRRPPWSLRTPAASAGSSISSLIYSKATSVARQGTSHPDSAALGAQVPPKAAMPAIRLSLDPRSLALGTHQTGLNRTGRAWVDKACPIALQALCSSLRVRDQSDASACRTLARAKTAGTLSCPFATRAPAVLVASRASTSVADPFVTIRPVSCHKQVLLARSR